ncbi:HlyD family type I secretion periplasmic adaptor subunit [Paucibacter sp. B2R-40]|uniref:HlyD family type I secretion periplasmic adaptor subunit n=1 Tax=Paucibacter sp. B2R-40 TaxID=2893554 RepID=UPI0021E36AA0|nr:HlyD family type I secretion periplasmic adaptor subunit [Paucibacter sp. B2R-40]MCV2357244.1 HlyD family type I secretion periplasmic adaptor subunit [Paucibacter sp. B2R-40]
MSIKSKAGGMALSREEGMFVTGLNHAQIEEPLPHAMWAIYLMLIAVVVALTWSALATVDEVTRSDGRIVPDGREQVIASLESGILRELFVREGEEVALGQELARLDPTRVEAQQNEGQAKRIALKAQAARLSAEASAKPLVFPREVLAVPRIAEAEMEAYEARRRVMDEAVSSIARSSGLLAREQKMAQDMAAKGLMSDVEVMRLSRQVNELQQQRAERISRFRQEASGELVRVQNELSQLDEQMVVREDAMSRTTFKSPVHGVVKNIRVSTVGGIVTAGAPIMEISPIGPRVLIEARVKPRDIGFVRVGQLAQVKLSGYDYNVYGGLTGRIEYISPDAMGETEKSAEGGYYRATVAAERNNLRFKGKTLPVIPGMTATVEIRTGERSVLSYLVRPMMKSQEALRER